VRSAVATRGQAAGKQPGLNSDTPRVIDGGRAVGMLTASDVMRAFVELLGEGVLSRPERWRTREGSRVN
jgi:hypothetical protein